MNPTWQPLATTELKPTAAKKWRIVSYLTPLTHVPDVPKSLLTFQFIWHLYLWPLSAFRFSLRQVTCREAKLDAFSGADRARNFTVDATLPQVVGDIAVKYEVDRLSGCKENRNTDRQRILHL